jgi:hypothetical protein
MNEWTAEWPTKPGTYWFYGLISRQSERPQLVLVRAYSAGNDRVALVAEGRIIYRVEASGYFMPAVLPEPPEFINDP